MDPAALAHLVTACAYAGFQWTVRVVVYPQLGAAGRAHPSGFPALEASHARRTGRLVGPLFAAQVTTAAVLVAARPGSPAAWACAGATALVLVVTALGAVPQHRVLGRGWDAAAHRRLLAWDSVRVAAATADAACAVLLALGLPGAG
ncbi:hypothetical protein [Quadrisphaera sp. DSM 44207]|uniref:hypothetical protein n=1 Tax=Quadrisphaera sp. DSM 44207 TaxID=1881057 RepID=UPI00087DF621|nr:hypothetical protein [Quadrisphaera sp. DSM 44207]SDQ67303.1 hypothetical protein SAMN05428996_2329 [Quadrisphaera sp. DSM 44207]